MGIVLCEATFQSSMMAGFRNVVLLQEPIAAAMAYGARPCAKDQYWMVFDFGGGTLDIAIVSTHNNRLTVINHEGDNYFGGKDLDEAFYRKIILPELKREFLLPEDPVEMEKIHRKILVIVEDAKKFLSTMESTIVDIYDVGEDEEGDLIEYSIEVTREEFNDVIFPIFGKCVDTAEKALKNAKLSSENLSKILLTGGSTFIPLIRQGLKEHFKVDVDFSIDPMTAVARGAAMYATTCECEVEQENDISKTDFTSDGVRVKIEHDHITSLDICNIVGRFEAPDNIRITQVKIDNSNGFWTSGWVDLVDADQLIFDIDLIMQENTVNHFIIFARDDRGWVISINDNEFSIRHSDKILTASAPPIPHSLCVEIIERGDRILLPVIKKGTSLPAGHTVKLRANKNLKPRSDDSIAIKLWEGEDFNYPDANQWVCNVYIKGYEINRPIFEGYEIELQIKIDESRKISIEVLVPELEFIKTAKDVYSFEPLDLQEPLELLGKDIGIMYIQLKNIQEEEFLSDEIVNAIYRLENDLHELDREYYECRNLKGIDDDRIKILLNKTEQMKLKFHELKKDLDGSEADEEETEILNFAEKVVGDLGEENDKEELERFKQLYNRSKDELGDRGRKTYLDRIDQLRWNILWNNYDVVRSWFIKFCHPEKIYIFPDKADYWKQQGLDADVKNDFEALREAVIQLIYLQDKSAGQVISEKNLPPGLRR